MSNSKFEYVKKFEQSHVLLPSTYIVVRIDGRGFTDFTTVHNFLKPNDIRGLKLMNRAAKEVMKSFTDIVIAYGQSDEYSFVFRKSTNVFNRREDKILSCVLSLFSSSYVFYFGKYFPGEVPKKIPSFDARIVLYPSIEDLKAYLSWRQVDCHINNLYNTTFWALVNKGGLKPQEAHNKLKGTFSKDKNEILFAQFGINYNNEEEMFKKGTTYLRMVDTKKGKPEKKPREKQIQVPNEMKQNEVSQDQEAQKEQKKEIEQQNMESSKMESQFVEKLNIKEIIRVHEDLIGKDTFYLKYELFDKLN